jgi:DNA-binding XRE family transcriptional regulator
LSKPFSRHNFAKNYPITLSKNLEYQLKNINKYLPIPIALHPTRLHARSQFLIPKPQAMRPKSREQQLAKDIYLQTQKTQQEIADILNINRKTIYLWIKHGKWEEMKIAARQAPCVVLQDIYNHIDQINIRISGREDHCPTPVEVDMLRKLLNMTKVIEKKHTGAYIEAFQELTMFIAKRNNDLAKQVTRFANDYVMGTIANKEFHSDETYRDIVSNIPPEDAEPLPDPEPATPPPAPSAPGAPSANPIPPSPEKTGQQQGHNEAIQANDGVTAPPDPNPIQSLPAKVSTGKDTTPHDPIFPKKENPGDGATDIKARQISLRPNAAENNTNASTQPTPAP